jgi:hypothetical protein
VKILRAETILRGDGRRRGSARPTAFVGFNGSFGLGGVFEGDSTGASGTRTRLWALTANEGGNPLTVTPLTGHGGRQYVELPSAVAAG